MEASEVVSNLRSALLAAKHNGQVLVKIQSVDELLDTLQTAPSQTSEAVQREHERSLAFYGAKNESSLALFNSAISAGREALNSAMLINGGAVVALLGFVGAVVGRGLQPKLGLHLAESLLDFGGGVLMASLGFGFRYISQACYSGEWVKRGHYANGASIFFGVASLALFLFGLMDAYGALVTQFSNAVP